MKLFTWYRFKHTNYGSIENSHSIAKCHTWNIRECLEKNESQVGKKLWYNCTISRCILNDCLFKLLEAAHFWSVASLLTLNVNSADKSCSYCMKKMTARSHVVELFSHITLYKVPSLTALSCNKLETMYYKKSFNGLIDCHFSSMLVCIQFRTSKLHKSSTFCRVHDLRRRNRIDVFAYICIPMFLLLIYLYKL